MVKTIADELAKAQKEISVAEFFEKNRHLLGFDSNIKAILTCVKEAVDNSLDACEEMIFELKKDQKKAKGAAAEETNKRIEDAMPDVKVEIKYAQHEFKVLDKDNHDRGFLILRHDSKHVVRIDDFEMSFERDRTHEITIREKDVDLHIDQNGRGEYKVRFNGEEFSTQPASTNRFLVCVDDNGPGIVEEQMTRVFGKLLYGSKFHRLKQSRGQQGIGISAAVLYGQLTTGKGAKIITRISEKKPALDCTVIIDTMKNEPEVAEKTVNVGFKRPHGTRVEIEVEGVYLSTGDKSVLEYMRRSSIANPHARLELIEPDGNKILFPRTSNIPPKEPLVIKPHPHGIELGILMRMIKKCEKRTLLSFLTSEFTRVGTTSAKEMVKQAGLKQSMDPKDLSRFDLEKLIKAMGSVNLMKPPTDCLSPIGPALLRKEIKEELKPEFVVTVTREPSVYRGMPFQIECGLAYGGNISEGSAKVMRFANKVPLMYEKGSCAITQSVSSVDWRRYNLSQPGGSGLPNGPLIILVHMCSVWVPFKSEAKSAVAEYPVIVKEIKLAAQECARQLGVYLARKTRDKRRRVKIGTFIKYSTEVAKAITGLTEEDEKKIKEAVEELLKNKFGDINGIRPGDKEQAERGREGPAEPDTDESEPELSDSDEDSE